jgi:hypothetical protein
MAVPGIADESVDALHTYELSVLTRARVNPGQRLHYFRPENLHGYLQGQRPHNPESAACIQAPGI